MEKVIFDVAGMRCGACAIGIELALAKMKGVKSSKVSLNENGCCGVRPGNSGNIVYRKGCERSRIYSNSKKVNSYLTAIFMKAI